MQTGPEATPRRTTMTAPGAARQARAQMEAVHAAGTANGCKRLARRKQNEVSLWAARQRLRQKSSSKASSARPGDGPARTTSSRSTVFEGWPGARASTCPLEQRQHLHADELIMLPLETITTICGTTSRYDALVSQGHDQDWSQERDETLRVLGAAGAHTCSSACRLHRRTRHEQPQSLPLVDAL